MISVIIPVYNGETFLEKSVRSVLNQTERDIQLILVNDGSTDGSGALCDQCAALDDRVTVIHQKNAGVSAARNAGLDAARGEYIGFVDADDYIAENTYEISLCAMGDSDIVMWDAVTVWENGTSETDTIRQLPENCILKKDDWHPELLLEMAGVVWRCLYRRELLDGIRFPVGVKFSEDRVFNLYAMGKARQLSYMKQGLYYRVMQQESAVHRYHGDYFEACKKAQKATEQALMSVWSDEAYHTAYQSQLIGGAMAAINNYFYKTSPLTWKERLEKVKLLCADSDLQEALRKSNFGGLRAKLMKKKQVVMLCCLAWLANKKYGR